MSERNLLARLHGLTSETARHEKEEEEKKTKRDKTSIVTF